MFITVVIISIAAIGLFFVINKISTNRAMKIQSLERQRNTLIDKYDFMIKRRKELRKLVEQKEQEVQTLRNSSAGLKTLSSKDLDIVEVDENQKVSNYLIQEGKISVEQNEKILNKMDVMKIDYLGACLAMGFIDMDTAKRAIKINKLTSKSILN